ncbi:DUF445 domain-containing protein [Mesobacillus maritimus]|uniref:DUF445 domain-containing protein n=1 Tax=Mesobacillus maritimus TaxID=1643336 RepID=UPI0020426292|nr:DUF445 domain-containing protein [Mesobacillus maritimus]MCM3588430.1 DUF445 domain-containing protein [Mesobacillus maritimus]
MNKQEKKSRYLAGISLAIMGAGFLTTIPVQDQLWGRLLQGGFEAGLVGGLADWFAVTALFRHPLGIPIPHTALLPKNRDRITKALVRMLENEWLTVTSITEKMKKISFTDKILNIIRKELDSTYTKAIIQRFLNETIEKMNFEQLSPLLEKEIKHYLYDVDAPRFLKSVADGIVTRGYDESAFDYILQETEKWAKTAEAKQTMGKLGKQLIETSEADGLLKFAIQSFNQFMNEERLGQMMQTFLLNRIRNVRKADNRYRMLILEWIRKELVEIDKREQLMNEINDWKDRLVDDLKLESPLNQLLDKAKERMVQYVNQEDFVDKKVIPMILRFLTDLEADDSKVTAIEKWIHSQVALLIERNHSKIGALVKENLDKLETETLIDMMENHIGKDIQWIRVNGAVCGFFIGLVLTIFKMII